MPLLPHSSDTEAIVGIQFGVFSPDEIIRRSVCEITNASTADGKLNGLFDPRMGVLENGKVCRSCGQNNHNCPGHFGHFALARPVYYTQFFKLVMKLLRCVCFKCGKLLIDKERNQHMLKLKGESRWKLVYEACAGTTRCGEDIEDGCGARQPNKYKEEPVHRIFAEWKDLALPEGVIAPEGAVTDDDGNVSLSMPLEPEYVHRLLRRVTDEDTEFMGFSRHWCRPDWLMCSVLPIPPPQVRPSVTQDNNQRSEDDLTSKLIDIIKANSSLKKKIAEDPKKRYIDEWTNLLQYHVATLVDNNIPGVSPAAQRSGRLLKSLQQRLGSKEGRIRSNLQGKRVEFSARSVITPDPNISVKELGIPVKIATNLTYPEMVTAFNKAKLYKLVQNGPDNYPGAKTIARADGRTISLKHVNAKTLELYEGDTVHRHLMDGDIVLFNRQPSLHRMSMMAHVAKILPYNTFRLNVFVTAPYNADFDGDEMNLHCPQSVEAATELRMIAAVPLQIVSPRESVPIVSVVQDTLVGANRFTRDGVLFTKKETMNLLVHSKRWDGKLPEPVTTVPQPMWSGKQLLSALLPPVSLQMKNNSDQMVKILNGEMLEGILDKSVFSKQLLHIIYNDYGPEVTVDFLDSLQAMIANFLMNSGFSVGISDLIADNATNSEIQIALKKITKAIEDQILQLHTGLFENTSGRSNQEEFEGKVMSTLNKAVGEAGKIGLKSLADTNRMTNMIKAGSKGSDVNVSQMVATLGQQAIEGKRVPNGFQNRTLPHFKRFDDSAQARGFISSSYIKGLQPDEFFFHAMSGREGLIDTAVKTADTGYMQRQIRVALEDLITQHDGSVRDATGNLLQIAYGEDGANATKLENQMLPLAAMSTDEIRQYYAADGAAKSQEYVEAAIKDRDIIVNYIYRGKPQKNVRYPVHLERLIMSLKAQFNLQPDAGTVTAEEALAAQATILNRTHAHNMLWAALVRYHIAPLTMKKLGYTPVSLGILVEQVVLRHWKSWVEPGQPVGVIAAQSIGEPATQMTLNSVDWDTRIMIAKNGKIITTQIGEFIDDYYERVEAEKVQRLPNDQIYIELNDGNDWKAISCDANGTMLWTKLEAITRHPVINADGSNTILEVTLESGRTVKATKAKSFLTCVNNKIIDTNGSDLRPGDKIPIANNLVLDQLTMLKSVSLRAILPPTEWLYGVEVEKALKELNSEDRHWFQKNQGKLFTIPYSRSDAFRDAFENGKNTNTVKNGCVYPKRTRPDTSHIPEDIPLTKAFGFFVGAYLAEGMSNTTQICITNNDEGYLNKVQELMDEWNIGTHRVKEERNCKKTGIKGITSSIIVHSTLLAKVIQEFFGRISSEKNIPDWVFQAPDEFVHGLVDGYISGDGCVQKKSGIVSATSVSKALLTRFSTLLSRFGIFSTMSTHMPDLGAFQSVKRNYTLHIPAKYSRVFAKTFTLFSAHKQERLVEHFIAGKHGLKASSNEAFEDIICDTVKEIKEIKPMCEWVYDVTVEKTRNFMTESCIGLRDTFHLAGVAAKSNMTRGVPRLKELLKATKNPKAVELTIPLRHDLRTKKEEARRVAQELEFTLLQDLVTIARIYYDPRDSQTLIAEDQDWLAYMAAYESSLQLPQQLQHNDGLAAGVQENIVNVEEKKSPWILRFELDRDRMFSKNITMEDIAFILRSKFTSELQTIYTDYNAPRLVFRARLSIAGNPIDDLNSLKLLQNKVLSATAIRGMPGLRSVNYQKVNNVVELKDGKYSLFEQYVLVSDGSNFQDVITHPDIDPTRVVSSNVHDMMANLGIEATRATLLKEITTLFEESGSSVNYRHVSILIDKMCHKGLLMSIDRYGIQKNDIGPLAKMSFEQTEDISLRAAIFGERDPVLGISAKVMLGAPIRAGTAFSEVLFDEAAAVKLAESTPEQNPQEVSGPTQFTEDELDNAVYGRVDRGVCGTAMDELTTNLGLPSANQLVTEEEVPDIDVNIVD